LRQSWSLKGKLTTSEPKKSDEYNMTLRLSHRTLNLEKIKNDSTTGMMKALEQAIDQTK
jgi:hypothetical protein